MSDGSGCNHERYVKSFRVPTSLECEQCGKAELLCLRAREAVLATDKVGLLNIIADLQDRITELEKQLHGTVTTDYHDKLIQDAMNLIAGLEHRNAELEKAARAVVDSGSMCMDLQVVSMAKVNALAAHLDKLKAGEGK